LLLEHLRKFPVSATGGLMLAKLVILVEYRVRETNNVPTGISNHIRTQLLRSIFQHSTNGSSSFVS
jgi:hypothetical protein